MTNYDNYYLNGQYRTRAYSRTISRNVYRYRDNTVMNNGLDRDFIERRTNTRVRENNITFRETDSYTDRPSRTNNQIEFRVPRERSDQRDFSNMQINRGDRRSTLATDKVTIGERKVLEERERARQEKTRIEREKNATRETQTQNNNTRTPDVRQEPQQRNNENRDPAVLRGGNNQQGRENTQTQRTPTVQRGDNRQIENRTMGNTRTETRERQTPQSGNRERTNSNDRQTQGDRPSRTR
jgi:hypothetical protein